MNTGTESFRSPLLPVLKAGPPTPASHLQAPLAQPAPASPRPPPSLGSVRQRPRPTRPAARGARRCRQGSRNVRAYVCVCVCVCACACVHVCARGKQGCMPCVHALPQADVGQRASPRIAPVHPCATHQKGVACCCRPRSCCRPLGHA